MTDIPRQRFLFGWYVTILVIVFFVGGWSTTYTLGIGLAFGYYAGHLTGVHRRRW